MQVVLPFLHIFMGLFKYIEEKYFKELEVNVKVSIGRKEIDKLVEKIDLENEKLSSVTRRD